MNVLLQVIVLLCAVVIVARAEPALNRMSKDTPFLIRIAFHSLALGGMTEIVFILSGEVPPWPMAIVTAGIAIMLVCDRRLPSLFPPPRRSP